MPPSGAAGGPEWADCATRVARSTREGSTDDDGTHRTHHRRAALAFGGASARSAARLGTRRMRRRRRRGSANGGGSGRGARLRRGRTGRRGARRRPRGRQHRRHHRRRAGAHRAADRRTGRRVQRDLHASGCVVAAAGNEFDCPCHGSMFDAATGDVDQGPGARTRCRRSRSPSRATASSPPPDAWTTRSRGCPRTCCSCTPSSSDRRCSRLLLVVLAAWPAARRVLWLPALIGAVVLLPLASSRSRRASGSSIACRDAARPGAHRAGQGHRALDHRAARDRGAHRRSRSSSGAGATCVADAAARAEPGMDGGDAPAAPRRLDGVARLATSAVVARCSTIAAVVVGAGATWTIIQIGEAGAGRSGRARSATSPTRRRR